MSFSARTIFHRADSLNSLTFQWKTFTIQPPCECIWMGFSANEICCHCHEVLSSFEVISHEKHLSIVSHLIESTRIEYRINFNNVSIWLTNVINIRVNSNCRISPFFSGKCAINFLSILDYSTLTVELHSTFTSSQFAKFKYNIRLRKWMHSFNSM